VQLSKILKEKGVDLMDVRQVLCIHQKYLWDLIIKFLLQNIKHKPEL
jgi:hypothetical protein